ncbi:MAG: M1 family metallopeptidase [Gemmatimonadota bacterium]
MSLAACGKSRPELSPPEVAPPAPTVEVAPDMDFRNGVEYRVEARLEEGPDLLNARAELRYTNRSREAIDTLWFQQYLNAFRPNSGWATYDAEHQDESPFQELGPDEHAFERISAAEIDGQGVTPVYPGAPDSTVMALPLARPLARGQTVVVRIDWQARLATLARRQGRRGRHFDFAQWYPRIAVYDDEGWKVNPLIRPGEFFGEFGAWDVTLDLAADQVVASTGVPVSGDPGYEAAAAAGFRPFSLARDAYGEAPPAGALGLLAETIEPGRKRVRFLAEEVHHFAWSTSPEYIYEGGRWKDLPVHVLYQPGDEEEWGNGVVLERTYAALDYMQEIFDTYPWPQFTNIHRIEGGGTEFPMLIMDGGAQLGLIVHETAHQYAHGILASNEWRHPWLDEGMASFLTTWFGEASGGQTTADAWGGLVNTVGGWDGSGESEVVDQHAADFSSFQAYGRMSYNKGSAVLYMARELLGEDAMRRGLKLYYQRNKFSHPEPADLRAALEEASGQDLAWFFDQWLFRTTSLDYAIAAAETVEVADGWRTTVTVTRAGDAWMPVDLQVGDARRRLTSREREQTVEVTTSERPAEARLDPDQRITDADDSNDSAAL